MVDFDDYLVDEDDDVLDEMSMLLAMLELDWLKRLNLWSCYWRCEAALCSM